MDLTQKPSTAALLSQHLRATLVCGNNPPLQYDLKQLHVTHPFLYDIEYSDVEDLVKKFLASEYVFDYEGKVILKANQGSPNSQQARAYLATKADSTRKAEKPPLPRRTGRLEWKKVHGQDRRYW